VAEGGELADQLQMFDRSMQLLEIEAQLLELARDLLELPRQAPPRQEQLDIPF